MRTIIHDLNDKEIKRLKFNNNDKLISALKCNKNCIGCFSCWVKTPTKCAIKDEFSNLTSLIKESDELILISKNRYGCYSNEVKKVLERCIGYVLPYFTIRNKEIHHKSRYDDKLKLSVYFYGEINEYDKFCIDKLVKANGINLNASSSNIHYYSNIKEIFKCTL